MDDFDNVQIEELEVFDYDNLVNAWEEFYKEDQNFEFEFFEGWN